MTDPSNPFFPDKFKLASCELERIVQKDALPIASTLASMDPWRKANYSTEGLAKFLLQDDPSLHRYKVMRKGKIVGVICVQYPWLRGCYIALIAVFKEYAGKGIGRDLIRWLGTQMRGRFKNIWALVSDFNADAREFYKKQGFSELAQLKDLVVPGFDEILIRKILD
jgi:ribosomal protein S18 acetylase RimI-like enzyme